MALKLSKLTKYKTSAVPVEIKNPETGEFLADEETGERVVAWVYGKASDKQREYDDKVLATQLERAKKGKKATDSLTVESVRVNELDYPVAMTAKITGLETDDGKPYDNPEAIRKLFKNEDKHVEVYWILEQVVDAINNDANFI